MNDARGMMKVPGESRMVDRFGFGDSGSVVSENLVVRGLVTDEGGNLITQDGKIQPWTAAVAKAVTAPLPVRPVLERAALAWRGDLFLGVAVPMTFPQTFTRGYVDPVLLYPLEPNVDASGYFAGLRALLRGESSDAAAQLRRFAMSVAEFRPAREEVEAVVAAVADFADAVKGMGFEVFVDVFRLRAAMLRVRGASRLARWEER